MKLLVLLPLLAMVARSDRVNDFSKDVQKVIGDIVYPIEETIVTIGSSQCDNAKKLLGVSYEQLDGKNEPDVDHLTLVFVSRGFNVSYNINEAADLIPENPQFNRDQKLFIYIHDFNDDPSKASFGSISNALLNQGEHNVLALDSSSLIRFFYLRSTTYVRFIGEKLGEVLADMVGRGVDRAGIHIIGHGLGAHIASFTGKTFTKLTGLKVGRITGLDPAGPCYSQVAADQRLDPTDADFVDVIHTDAGVAGLKEPCGQVDYYPNKGSQQPNCFFQSCSHSRAWMYYAESVTNPEAFPAAKCSDWEQFKKGNCDTGVSDMGLPSKPGTKGLYFLQTGGESPYGKGLDGIKYENDKSEVTSILG